MRGLSSCAVLVLGGFAFASSAVSAEVSIAVNKTTQRMTVSVDGVERHSWSVSTGMADYATPVGIFAPSRLAKEHYSREWDNAPMPHSIFFTDAGHAIHGSRATGRLGSPASHGCIRLAPQNARILFELVMTEGPDNTRIEITGVDPIGTALGSGHGAGRNYSRLTSFDPLTVGIIAGGASRLRSD
jgi:hypothetical protein